MNSRRKILAVLLLVVLAVSLLSVCALAADDGDDVPSPSHLHYVQRHRHLAG